VLAVGPAQLAAGRKDIGRIALRIWFRPESSLGSALLRSPGMIFQLVRVFWPAQPHLRASAGVRIVLT